MRSHCLNFDKTSLHLLIQFKLIYIFFYLSDILDLRGTDFRGTGF